jgi:ComEC/Rec2-related protein
VALAAIAGILFTEYISIPSAWLIALTIVALIAALVRPGTPALLVAVASAFALAHGWQWRDTPARQWAAQLAPESREVRVIGVLTEEPKENPPGVYRAPLRVERWQIGSQRIDLTSEVVVRWSPEKTPRYGDRWDISGVISRIPPPRNPAEFNAADWWGRRGVFLELRGGKDTPPQLLARHAGSPLQSAALSARAWMLHTLGLGLDNAPQMRALIAGLTLGVRDTGADEFADAFRQTGTFHLFSVSGLHVGMVALLLWLVLCPLGLSRRRAVLVIIPSLFFYALITGASPPSIRAAVMLSVAFAGFLLDRPVSPASSLAAAALLLLGYDTNQLFSPGFQMSFSIVAAIFLLSPPLQEWFSRRLRPDPFLPRRLYTRRQEFAADAGHGLASTLGVSSAAWLGSLPLTLVVFHLLPVLAIPANMLSVPLAFGILAVSMLALLAGPFSAWLTTVFNNTSWGLASVLVAVVESTAALPGSYVRFPPGWLQPPARLTVFDLGEGGAQLLRTPQKSWLFDSGSAGDFRRIIDPALRAAGITHLDALVVTHGDADHIGGAPLLFTQAPPHRLIESVLRDRSRVRRSLHASMQAGGQPKTLVLPGDWLQAGRATTVQFLAPESKRGGRSADDQAIVARLETGGFGVLLMSDAGAGTESHLVQQSAADLRSDILVLGRHGDDIVATGEFLAAVQPRVVILGARDPFRHGRDEEPLRTRLAATGAEIFAQDECGAVITTIADDHMEVHGFLDGRRLVLPPRPAK